MFKFITSKPLWGNILAGIALVMILVVGFFLLLNVITDHNHYEKVPNIVGMSIQNAQLELEKKGFKVVVSDSAYDPNALKLSVTKQTPESDAMVKYGRTIYVTINRQTPPLVDMPNLVGFSLRSAINYLNAKGLVLGDTSFKPDMAKNTVLSQLYNGGEVKPGTKVPVGSAIALILGSGIGDSDMVVPNLLGQTYATARAMLLANNIGISDPIITDQAIRDTGNAFVIKQNPEPFKNPDPTKPKEKVPNKIRAGQIVDLYLGAKQPLFDSVGNLINTP